MSVTLAIDASLLEEAQLIGKHRTKKEAAAAALREYVQRRKQLEIIKLFDQIDYENDYDYKLQRAMR